MLAACAAAAPAAHDARGATATGGTEVSWDIADSKGNTYWWSMPVAAYEDSIAEGRYHVRDKASPDLDGETLRVVSLDGFVRESFVNVIDGIYDNSHGSPDLVWEVWHVVSRLTVYDEDIHEHSGGRYALETLTRGGGDCEDPVILVADMLTSSSHTDGRTIQFVIMDGDSPTDPQDIDRVILYVDDGEYAHYIEATAPPGWDYYPEGVNGWYLDVVLYTEDLDFVGQDLRWMDLAGSNLAGAVFSGARMGGADLTGADLSYADLAGADLSWAGLRSADLSFAGLAGANLSFADLSGAGLLDADMASADLSSANLYKVDLSGADLTGADLSHADLASADLSGATMSVSVMVASGMPGADLSHADLSGAVMVAADLTGAVLVWADLTGADLAGVDLSATALYDVLGR